jgi:aminopeptidase-like protein
MPGTNAPLVYAKSATGRSVIDRVTTHLLEHEYVDCKIVGFRESIGNDEIALDVAGVNIPCGSLIQWPYEHYHTDGDTEDKICKFDFERYVDFILEIIKVLENNARLVPKFDGLPCLAEPSINLYLVPPKNCLSDLEDNMTFSVLLRQIDSDEKRRKTLKYGRRLEHLRNLIPALADGKITTLEIAEHSGVPFFLVDAYVDLFVNAGLLEKRWVNPFEKSGKG